MEEFDVIGLGVSTLDFAILVNHFPAREEVQRAVNMTLQGGGPIATAVVTAARLGLRAAMLDAIGDDWRAAIIRESFRRSGVNHDYVLQREESTSSTACILVNEENGARSIVYFPGTASEMSPREFPRTFIESAKVLHVNGRHWQACLQAVDWAREASIQISFDGGAHRFRPEMAQLVPLTNICIVASEFAQRYTEETSIQKAAETLLRSGPGLIVITDGIKGSWIYSQDQPPFHQPAYILSPLVDTTGCGDSYHGAFLSGLLIGLSLERTAALASAVAALNSQHLGGQGGLPTLAEANAFLEKI